MLEGIGAVRPAGVHHRLGVGQHVLALVVVGDDQVQANFPAEAGFLNASDAAVHGNDKIHPLAAEAPQRVAAQAIAVLDAAGDILHTVGAPGAQIVHQEDRGGDAVHIVIPEHGDLLARCQGAVDPGHRLIHVLHQEGGVGQLPVPLQEGGGILRCGDAPGRQDGGEQAGIPGRAQAVRRGLVVVSAVPSGIFHRASLLSQSRRRSPGQTAPK